MSLVIQRSNRQRAHVVTHTLTIDAWLLTLLILFSLVSASSAFVLPGSPVAARRFEAGHVSPHVAGVPGGGVGTPLPTLPARAAGVKSFVVDPDPALEKGDPALAAAMQFLSWNTAYKEKNPEADFAAEVKRREAAKKARAEPRKIATAAELASELSSPADAPTVVVFGAKTCRMCKTVQPRLEKLAKKAGALALHKSQYKGPPVDGLRWVSTQVGSALDGRVRGAPAMAEGFQGWF